MMNIDTPTRPEALAPARLSGSVTGTDYVSIRADGRIQLHIHGRLTTPDGAHISLFAEAVGTMREGTEAMQVHEHVALYSAAANYAWVNGPSGPPALSTR